MQFDLSVATALYYAEKFDGVQYPVDFDLAWKWIGYTRKDNAKRILMRSFKSPNHFLIIEEMVKRDQGGGRQLEKVWLTLDCFKCFAMMANTAKGDEIRQYFLDCEKIALGNVERYKEEQDFKRSFEIVADRIRELNKQDRHLLYQSWNVLASELGLKQLNEDEFQEINAKPVPQSQDSVKPHGVSSVTGESLEEIETLSLAAHRMALSFNKHTRLAELDRKIQREQKQDIFSEVRLRQEKQELLSDYQKMMKDFAALEKEAAKLRQEKQTEDQRRITMEMMLEIAEFNCNAIREAFYTIAMSHYPIGVNPPTAS
jgi:phage anti-repressor protein